MTLYLLFAGLGTLIYAGVALAATAIADFSGAHVPFGLRFAFFASLLVLQAAVIVSYANRFPPAHASSVDRVSAWRRRRSSCRSCSVRAVHADTLFSGGE